MHRPAVSIQDIWKPGFIEIIKFPSMFKDDVTVLVASMFVNLKLHLFNKIIFKNY
jgi:hypothetical protein